MINAHVYQIEKINNTTYLLKQTVIVFEKQRQFYEQRKISDTDKVAQKVFLFPGTQCKDN